jgi:bifunctional DNA primase/polymerase-like protein
MTLEELAAAGLPIFPAEVYFNSGRWTKKPRIVGWQDRATTNLQTIHAWRRMWPGAVPGIDLGHAGLVVIDADQHGGPDGSLALAALIHGQEWPEHPIVATAGGGQHHYFRQPNEPLGNNRGALPEGIDIRGTGGWTLAPGAIRPDGARWRLVAGSFDQIPTLPTWLEAIIRRKSSRMQTPGVSHGFVGQTNHGTLLATAELPKPLYLAIARCKPPNPHEKRRVAGIIRDLIDCKSFRNNRLNSSGFALREFKLWVPRGVAVDLLKAASDLNGYTAKDGIAAVMATINSGLGPEEDWPL